MLLFNFETTNFQSSPKSIKEEDSTQEKNNRFLWMHKGVWHNFQNTQNNSFPLMERVSLSQSHPHLMQPISRWLRSIWH